MVPALLWKSLAYAEDRNRLYAEKERLIQVKDLHTELYVNLKAMEALAVDEHLS